jgi:hypothetical protein
MHIHVLSPAGEAKFWIDPSIELATSSGYSAKDLGRIEELIREKEDVIRKAWNKHFGG